MKTSNQLFSARLFPFHKHFMQMECRKDILFENDFINQKNKSKSNRFYSKYTDKLKQNKMRIAYILGFSVLFSLDFIYDSIFQSKLYNRIQSQIFDSAYLPALQQIQKIKIDYRSEEAIKLGQYFLSMQRNYPKQDINAVILSGKNAAFAQLGNQVLTINDFVNFCTLHSIKSADLPHIA